MTEGRDRLFIALVQALPRKPLSRIVGQLAGVRSKRAIEEFARRYGIAVDEAERPLTHYSTLREFFTRRLRPGARPLDPDPEAFVSPVDGTLDASGRVEAGLILQAKGRRYTLASLLADADHARRFDAGVFATLYLSPRDYHRTHAPADGEILETTYVPGDLFPVNPAAVSHVDSLFARNERVVTHIQTERFGRIAYVMIGATCVGRIHMSFDGSIATNAKRKSIRRERYDPPIPVARGDELGIFEMGSTVVVVVERGVRFDGFAPGTSVRVGMRIGACSA